MDQHTGQSQAWVMLIAAGLFEIVWALMLRQTQGFTKLWPSVLTLGAMGVSFWLLSAAVRAIPISVAYPIWVGIGVAGAWAGSVVFLGEAFKPWQLLWVGVIVLGIAMLKLNTAPQTRGNGPQGLESAAANDAASAQNNPELPR